MWFWISLVAVVVIIVGLNLAGVNIGPVGALTLGLIFGFFVGGKDRKCQ